MKSSIAVIVSLVAVITAVYLVNKGEYFLNKENFDAVGLVFNRPPEWYNGPRYKDSQWMTPYYPQQVHPPEFMSH